jgi:hypothetical protein
MDGIMHAIYFINSTGITGLRIEGDCGPFQGRKCIFRLQMGLSPADIMNFGSPKGAWRIGVMTSCLGGMTGYKLKKKRYGLG